MVNISNFIILPCMSPIEIRTINKIYIFLFLSLSIMPYLTLPYSSSLSYSLFLLLSVNLPFSLSFRLLFNKDGTPFLQVESRELQV